MKTLKNKKTVIFICALALIALIICLTISIIENALIRMDTPLFGQSFESTEAALSAYDEFETAQNDISLDFSPPYEYVDTIYIEDKAILIYKYSEGAETDIAMRFLEKTKADKWTFTNGFCWLEVNVNSEYYWQEGAYNFDNIAINNKKYALCFSFLPINSEKDIYVDNIKSEKIIITIPDGNSGTRVYLCYALSPKSDNLIKNLFTSVDDRHQYVIK